MKRIFESFKACLVFTLLAASCLARAAAPVSGEPLPDLTIDEKGEIFVVNDEIEFKTWSSTLQHGQWQLFQCIAARKSASDLNLWAVHEIEAERDAGNIQDFKLATIVNVSDVLFGAISFAVNALKKNKLKYPESTLVADLGHAHKRWELEPKSSALILLDPDNIVRFFHDGALSRDDVDQILKLLRPIGDSEN